jgi:hypothetical protein
VLSRRRRQRRRLRLVPAPPEGIERVRERTGEGTVFLTGDGAADWYCGGCDALLLVGIEPRQVAGIVFRCPQCEACNVVPD